MTASFRRAAARLLPRRSAGAHTQTSETSVRTGRRRALRFGAVGATALLLVGGGVAVAGAHKTVTLDVDGEVVTVSTVAGSVEGVLVEHGVSIGTRDRVTPVPDAALRSGDAVVVRYSRALRVHDGDGETTVWTTALTAEQALVSLALRGQDVRIMPSRSAGRAELPMVLADGPVDVVVDEQTHAIDGGVTLPEALTSLEVELGEFDRVQVHRVGDEQRLTVTVQRVVVEEVTSVTEEAFETVTERTSELYTDQRRTAVAGEPGERTVVERVVLVDGEEESSVVISDEVTTEPVDAVVQVGSRERPVAPARSSSGSGGGSVPDGVWGALAQCESGGNPSIVSSNGLYYGLYQFSLPTWRSVGGSGLPSEASVAEQTQRAQALQARSGWGQWPACARKLGLL